MVESCLQSGLNVVCFANVLCSNIKALPTRLPGSKMNERLFHHNVRLDWSEEKALSPVCDRRLHPSLEANDGSVVSVVSPPSVAGCSCTVIDNAKWESGVSRSDLVNSIRKRGSVRNYSWELKKTTDSEGSLADRPTKSRTRNTLKKYDAKRRTRVLRWCGHGVQ